MSGSTENRTSGAFERAGGPNVLFTWPVAQRMLPLVGQITQDILRRQRSLAQLQLEKESLDRQRRTLAWPQRSRRYQIEEDLVAEEAALQRATAELEALGVGLLDSELGLVGFPTTVNNRRAFFSWHPGEDSIVSWQFAEEMVRRPIPPSWTKPTTEPRRRGSRPEARS